MMVKFMICLRLTLILTCCKEKILDRQILFLYDK